MTTCAKCGSECDLWHGQEGSPVTEVCALRAELREAKAERDAALTAFKDATRLRSEIQQVRIKVEDSDRDLRAAVLAVANNQALPLVWAEALREACGEKP